jgi:hypothetical protein
MTRDERADIIELIARLLYACSTYRERPFDKTKIDRLCAKYNLVSPNYGDSVDEYADRLRRSDEIIMRIALE